MSFRYIESCMEFSESFTMQADLALNVVFLIYFFLRVRILKNERNKQQRTFYSFSLLHRNINEDFGLVYFQLLICLRFRHRLLHCI